MLLVNVISVLAQNIQIPRADPVAAPAHLGLIPPPVPSHNVIQILGAFAAGRIVSLPPLPASPAVSDGA